MSAQELEAWLLEQPHVLAYLALLFGGSLVSFIVLVRRISGARKVWAPSIPPWPIAGTDFALFLVALVLWFILSGALLLHGYRLVSGSEAAPGSGVMVLGGFLLQGGMLYLFLRFRFHFRRPNEGPLSPRILSTGQGLVTGLFYFLASLPVVYGTGVVWNGFLELLRSRGMEIDLPMQDAVVLFQNTRDPLTLFGMLVLAVVVAPVVEEAVFRGGVFRFLKGKVPLALALLASGFLFGLIHGNLQSLPGLVAVGVCLGLAYELSGSLKVPIFFHAFFNLNSVIWILLLPEPFAG